MHECMETHVFVIFFARKVFDATAGPFPFLPAKVYHFASERFIDATAPVQDQVLSWLEVREYTYLNSPKHWKNLLHLSPLKPMFTPQLKSKVV